MEAGPKILRIQFKKEKVEKFTAALDIEFSEYGPVLKDALGWLECEIVDRPNDAGANHYIVIGKFTNAAVNSKYYDQIISPRGNPKPFMQWERNNFTEASDILDIKYFNDPGF